MKCYIKEDGSNVGKNVIDVKECTSNPDSSQDYRKNTTMWIYVLVDILNVFQGGGIFCNQLIGCLVLMITTCDIQ